MTLLCGVACNGLGAVVRTQLDDIVSIEVDFNDTTKYKKFHFDDYQDLSMAALGKRGFTSDYSLSLRNTGNRARTPQANGELMLPLCKPDRSVWRLTHDGLHAL